MPKMPKRRRAIPRVPPTSGQGAVIPLRDTSARPVRVTIPKPVFRPEARLDDSRVRDLRTPDGSSTLDFQNRKRKRQKRT